MSVQTGLQVFLEHSEKLSGARVGLVTHPAAVLPDYTHSLDALLAAGVEISALFGPEHGYLGYEPDAEEVASTFDLRTGLPAYSLYGEQLSPTGEMLAGLDMILFDMQDVGSRFYTFISTLYHLLKAAGQYGKPVMVLDRPNPLGGYAAESPLIDDGYESFIGITSMPIQHGMTVGELAGYMNARMSLHADLLVIRMQDWKREMWFEDTGLPWVPTSPGIPHLSSAYLYPCTCLLEGTNISEGRGTTLPFEVIGAPWLDAYSLADALNELDLGGLRFRPTFFTPYFSKHAGLVCQGVQMHLSDPRHFLAVPAGLVILQKIMEMCPQFSFLETSWEGNHPHFDLLLGNGKVRQQLLDGEPIEKITASWTDNLAVFDRQRAPFLLYS